MALLLTPPPPAQKARARFANLTKSREDKRNLVVGLLITAAVWPGMILVAILVVGHFGSSHRSVAQTPAPPPVFSIELAQDEFVLPEKPPEPPKALPQRFVETNPDAPENIPDETRNFAAHNQQAAQEVPTPDGKSDLPSTKGENKEDTTQIVSGRLQSEPDTAPPPPPAPASQELLQAVREAQQQRERNPLPGDHNESGDSTTGYGFNLSKATENVENIPQRIEGRQQAPLIVTEQNAATPKVDPQRPQPRPRLDRKVRPAVLSDRPMGTSNIGITAADARWSQYGQYLQRLIDSVQIEWERILISSKTHPPLGSRVEIKFILDKEGEIAEIVETESNAGTQGTRACQSAITSRAPYGKWTDDMLAALGERQELTFTFFYQ